MDERTYLKVKVKSLAEEARIIRKETKKAKLLTIKNGLALHRKGVVRREARHTHLAYGFLRGRKYREIENKAYEAPDWKKVRKMVEKYGSHNPVMLIYSEWNIDEYRAGSEAAKQHLDETLERFDLWVKEASESLQAQEEENKDALMGS